MKQQLRAQRNVLLTLTKHDPDPTVRHRAHVLIAALDHSSWQAAATACGVSVRSMTRWAMRCIAEGRTGLADRPRPGRPSKLPEMARALLRTALTQSPEAYGYPITVWTIADLTDLLARHGWSASAVTVNRMVHAMGYVYRRPRHDLRHRQDTEAVASAANTLAVLQKKGLISAADFASSILTNANSTPIPTWSIAGASAASQPASPPPEPINGLPSSEPWSIGRAN